MPEGVNLKLNPDLISQLDELRGDLSRDEFINRILNDHLKKEGNSVDPEEEFIDLGTVDDDEKLKFQSQTQVSNVKFKAFMDDFKEFSENINDRLDRLEVMVNTLSLKQHQTSQEDYTSDVNEYLEDEDEVYEDTEEDLEESFAVEDDSGEPMIFELDKKDDSSNGSSLNLSASDDFEYGCPFCNATIDQNATSCPKCGNNFSDFVDEAHDAVPVEPLTNGYSDTGEYDPRPRYMKRNSAYESDLKETAPWPKTRAPTIKPGPESLCAKCGNELTYLDEYKRYYCFKCKQYAGTISSPAPRPDMSPSLSPSVRKTPTIADRRVRGNDEPAKKSFHGKGKPLKGYPKYKE